jgi:hypothetical protein
MSQAKGGRLVRLANGKTGKTKNSDLPVANKIRVYLEGGDKVLVRPEKLTIIGYWD